MEIGTPPTPLRLSCADPDHLAFLAAGDAALTRRAKAASGLSAVVVRFIRSRGRYERQSVLVEEDALAAAEQRCLADEDLVRVVASVMGSVARPLTHVSSSGSRSASASASRVERRAAHDGA